MSISVEELTGLIALTIPHLCGPRHVATPRISISVRGANLAVYLFDGQMGDVFNDIQVCQVNGQFLTPFGLNAATERFSGRGWRERLAQRVAELVEAALAAAPRKN